MANKPMMKGLTFISIIMTILYLLNQRKLRILIIPHVDKDVAPQENDTMSLENNLSQISTYSNSIFYS